MKHSVSALVLAIGLSTPAWAETDSGFYLGLTAGSDKVNVDGVDNASGAGLMAGWRINKNVAIEFSGHSSDADADEILPGCVFEIDTVALYLAARSSGQVYAKGRMGMLSETVTPRDSCAFTPEQSESGISIGAGGGVRMGKAALELEYTMVEADVDRLSVSVLYNF